MVEVYLNGLRLKNTTDYTATNGSTVVLTSPAAVNDEIEIIGLRHEMSPRLTIRIGG